MSCDLLPEWLNLFLDDVETTLCLPILLIMVLCTLQFIVNHAMDIGFTFYQNIMQKSEEEEVKTDKGESLMDKIRGYICNVTCVAGNTDSKQEESAAPSMLRSNLQEEEWDYCEDDEEK